jgi:hypothetical protein
VVWEDGDGVVVWERDGRRWVRIPSAGPVEEVPAAAAEELVRTLRHLEWREELRGMGDVTGVLSVDGQRLRLGAAEEGQISAWDGERRMALALDGAAVERLRWLLQGDGSAAALPPEEDGEGQEDGGAEQ